MNESTQVLRLR